MATMILCEPKNLQMIEEVWKLYKGKNMKLYEVPNCTAVRVMEEGRVPPRAHQISSSDIIDFHHIDGMYSYCTNQKGEVVPLAAWTEVEIVK